MKVFTAIIPLLLIAVTSANPTFRIEDGVLDARCPAADNAFNPTHLPHSTDCSKFLKCFNGRAYTIDCPPGQEFGAQIHRCDFPSFAQCKRVLAEPDPAQFVMTNGVVDTRCPKNDNPMNPTHLSHPASCRKFMKCFSGMSFELDCPPGQEWANHLNRCDFPSIAMCSISRPYVPEEEDEEENHEQTVEEQVIDESQMEVEAMPVKAEFVYSSGIPDTRCPRNDDPFRPVHLPHATDCSKFHKCFDGRAYPLDCPPGQEFGARLNRCDFPQFAQCSLPRAANSISKKLAKAAVDDYYWNYDDDDDSIPADSSEWTEEQKEIIAGVVDIRCPKEDDPDFPIHLTHPKDCNRFYKCYNGRAYLIMCPKDQHWSIRYDRCDHPNVAKCTVRM
ncbi:chondroitin proteoglycan-2-like [Uranotaenia lowii]|uniref:chondroitin proteoglycan-2-like n=1 Tax=Uranotaenia lowii TaxID=190385 RepID=UPI00247A4FF4|nr:chondroitin proteoglycan-2-like [Uranotaenia lowii]